MTQPAIKAALGLVLAFSIGPAVGQSPPLETGLHYYAVENLDRGTVDRRGTAGSKGVAFSRLILAPSTRYRLWILQAESLLVGRVEVVTPAPGARFEIPEISLKRTSSLDADGDRLHDVGEFILGTGGANPDSDGDGVTDGAEVRQGTDPLDGIAARTGLIASLALPGKTSDLATTSELLVVAHGVAITGLNIFTGLTPTVVLRIPAPEGGSIGRVAASGGRIAAAAGPAGLLIIDARDPAQARTTHLIPVPALLGAPQALAAAAGIAYAGLSTSRIAAVDMASGAVLSHIAVDSPVQDLAIEGETLFAVTESTLHAIRLDPGDFTRRGFAVSQTIGPFSRLFVGGRVAYGVYVTGYNAFDVADPGAPSLIRRNSTGQFGWKDVALNGSGLLLAATGPNGVLDGSQDLSLYDARDPAAAPQLVTTFETPGSAVAIEIANGLSFVADHDKGLQVYNHLSDDIDGRPPAITLELSFDPAGADEGTLAFLRARVTDDVEVRNVDFVVNGAISTDTSFPFEHHFVVPRFAVRRSLTLLARAFDTGGNSALTEEIFVPILLEQIRPTVRRTVPADKALVGRVPAVAAFFSETLNPLTVTPANFRLFSAGLDGAPGTPDDVPVAGGTVEFRAEIRAAFHSTPSPLGPGRYQARLGAALADPAGNTLGADHVWTFLVYGSGGDGEPDGLPDVIEAALGLDPAKVDTDGDGTRDGDEDFDGDGLANALEVALGTDPANTDTDGDGIRDGQADSDRDGLRDGEEVARGSDPFRPDTDGDGFPDGLEVAHASNPADPLDTPVRSAFFNLSVFNRAAPAAVEGTVDGPVFTVENKGNP